MASSSKKRTTMAKLARENKLRERRAEKQARREARRSAHPTQRPMVTAIQARSRTAIR